MGDDIIEGMSYPFSYLTGEVGKLGIFKIKHRIVVGNNALIYDTFTGANGTVVNGRTPAPINTPGGAYFSPDNLITIQSNKAFLGGGTGGRLAVAESGLSDCVISSIFSAPGAWSESIFEIIARYTDATHHWKFTYFGPSAILLIQEYNTSFTNRAVVGLSLTTGVAYTMIVTLSGNNLSVLLNSTTLSYTSSLFSSATKHGFNLDGDSVDDFTVVPL